MRKLQTGEKNMSDSTYRKNLYRLPAKGKVFGVCAGIAEYLEWDSWKIRLITIVAAILTGFWLVFIAYMVAFFILEPAPKETSVSNKGNESSSRFSERLDEVKQTFQAKTHTSKISIEQLEEQFANIKKRVEKMEAHVTSGRFELEREFRRMAD